MKLSDKEKQELVKQYLNGISASDICLQHGISKSTFYSWVKPHKTATTNSGNVVSISEVTKLKKRVEYLENKVAILQTVGGTVSAPLREKLVEVAMLHGQYSVHVLCDTLNVDRGTFYNHILHNKSKNNI